MATAKDIAKTLGISEASVSIALNGKPGVSSALRQRICETANSIGLNFTKEKLNNTEEIYLFIFVKTGVIISGSPFFEPLFQGISDECVAQHLKLSTCYIRDKNDLAKHIQMLPPQKGFLLLATEAVKEDCECLSQCKRPFVVLDAYFDELDCNYVLINNVKGAYEATQYLIRQTGHQPGYLHSSYTISNFQERADGFFKAVRLNGFSASDCIVHRLRPSAEDAYQDMKAILADGGPIADCYFADHDPIAAGAMQAFKDFGMRVPEDVAIIGFDNIPMCEFLNPSLTTINVPKAYLGQQAVTRLLSIMRNNDSCKTKTEISPLLVRRKSC